MSNNNGNKTTNKTIVISERDNIATLVDGSRVVEFFIHRGDMLLGDVYLATVENILPSIDAAFVNLGADRMGFLHASDVPGKGELKDRLEPKQKILVQVMKEPTGHKGPRVSTSLSLPGRFLVLMPEEKGISISRKILSPKERSRLKSIVNLYKPPGIGVIIRTEAESQSDDEIKEDMETLLEKWKNIVTTADSVTPPSLIHRDQDLLYRVIREACTEDIKEIFIDTPFGQHRVNQLIQTWNLGKNIKVNVHKGNDSLLIAKGIDKEIKGALQTKVNMPSGGYLYIQQTEALTVIDVNSGKFTSSQNQNETIRQTNIEAVDEISRQLRLRNIGGMTVIDFIDMESRVDQLQILEALEMSLLPDKAKPQVGQLSDLGLVELTRHRQGQSLVDIFTKKCPACGGSGVVIEDLNFAPPTIEGDLRIRTINKPKIMPRPKASSPVSVNKQDGQQTQSHQSPQQQSTQQQQQQQQQHKGIKQPMRPMHSQVVKPQVAQPIEKPKLKLSDEDKLPDVEKIELYAKQPFTEELETLNINKLRKIYQEKKFYPEISKTIRFAGIPLKCAKENFPEEVNMVDVFAILGELEAAFAKASTIIEVPPKAILPGPVLAPIIPPEIVQEELKAVKAVPIPTVIEKEDEFKGRYGISTNGENFEDLYEVIEDEEIVEEVPVEVVAEVEEDANADEEEEKEPNDENKDDDDSTASKKIVKRGRKPAADRKKPSRGRPKSK